MKEDYLEILKRTGQEEAGKLLALNPRTEDYGLTLSEAEAAQLMAARTEALFHHQRVEFGESVLPRIVYAFCDSQYIDRERYVETLMALQDLFYRFKNASEDRLTDDELIAFMREQFDGVCFGSLDYLASTCLERFARAIRAGYDGYQRTEGRGEYEQFSEETRWEKEVYDAMLRELIF